MFFRLLLSGWTLFHFYVFWRAATVPMITRRIPRKFLLGAGFLLWAGFFPARLLSHDDQGLFSRLLELYLMHWMAILFLTAVALLVVDLVTLFGLVMPRLARRLRGWALVAGVILSVIAFIQGLRSPVVRDYQVTLPGLPIEADGTVLIALSDLHVGTMIGEEWLAARVAQVQDLEPDVVVLLGDIFEGHGRHEEEFLPILGRLDAPLGVWAVMGNHEFHGSREGGKEVISGAGFEMLHDRWVKIRPGLVLAGVDDLTRRLRRGLEEDHIGQALEGRPPGAAVLFSHSPLQAETAAAAGAGLMLSAHTHGGQIWPFGYLVRLRYPLLAGRYEVSGMPVIVSRGTGTWGPRMRLWRRGEILRVILRAPEGLPREN